MVSQVGLSNNTAEKFLTALAKKLGYRFFPRYLKRVLSRSLNTFRQCLTCEVIQFKDKTGELAEPTTLVYTEDLKGVIDKTIEARGIVSPFINIGTDGGKDKEIVVLQVCLFLFFLAAKMQLYKTNVCLSVCVCCQFGNLQLMILYDSL